MKVLFVSHTGLMSGAEGALLDLIQALPARVIPSAICPPGPLAEALRAMDVGVTEFQGATGSWRLDPCLTPVAVQEILSSAFALRARMAASPVDVVHANSLRAGLITGCAQTFRRVPTVVHVHDALPPTRTAAVVRRVVASTSNVILTISEYTAQKFVASGSREAILPLGNPLDTERFDPRRQTRQGARSTLGLRDEEKLIGLVAQITPWKGHDVAIRALAAVHARHPGARLLVVGDVKFAGRAIRFDNFEYLRYLHRLVADLELERDVEFLGERSDIATIMRAIDVLVAPSWEEPFGRSLIEAMAMETAVVATDIGGPSEYLEDGVDGLLVSPTDVTGWAEAVARLFDDPALRAAMGSRSSAKVRERFERGAYAEEILRVYEGLLNGRRARPPLQVAGSPGPLAARRCADSASRRWRGRRILFVEHTGLVGGGQRSLLELMRVLAERHDLTLACPPGPLAKLAGNEEFNVVSIPESQLTLKFHFRLSSVEVFRALQARRALRKHIELIAPDIVHANSLRAGLLVNRPDGQFALVVHCRDLLPVSTVSSMLQRVILRRSSAVVAVSTATAQRLAGRCWAEQGVVVIDNPVDGTRFDPDRPESSELARLKRDLRGPGLPLLGVVAQITPWKGQHRAVQVLEQVRRTHPAARLLIVGETKFVTPATRFDNRAYEQQLRRLVQRLGLTDAVDFLGEREDVDGILAALDVLLVPSTEEPFGRAVIEALAMRLPVVATNAGGPPEIIRPDVDGYVVAPDDLEAWAAAVRLAMNCGGRPESRTYALHRFNPARHAAAVLSVYDSLRGQAFDRSRNA